MNIFYRFKILSLYYNSQSLLVYSSVLLVTWIFIYVLRSFLLSIPSFGILLCQAPVHIVITLARLGTSKKIGTRNYGWLYLR